VMTPKEKQILLGRLIVAMQRGVITVELVNRLLEQTAEADMPESKATITARVRDYEATDGAWLYWWHWRQPISSIHDLERMVDRFCDVVLAVEGKA
jgi:hypothetical protein